MLGLASWFAKAEILSGPLQKVFPALDFKFQRNILAKLALVTKIAV